MGSVRDVQAIGEVLCSKSEQKYWDALCDGEAATDNPLASTLLDVFNYYAPPQPDAESCAAHTDYGLLTLIPAQFGGYVFVSYRSYHPQLQFTPMRVVLFFCCVPNSPGLELWDWQRGEWASVEHALNANECVVFAGESLSRLTADHILAALHRVVRERALV